MRIWIVLCCDRHCDPDPRPFVSVEDAMSEAHGFADEYKVDPEDGDRKGVYHNPDDDENGIAFTQSLSEEGDSVTVYRRDLGT